MKRTEEATMEFVMDGRKISREAAYRRIAEEVPNGGIAFLNNVILNGEEDGVDTVTIHVGAKSTLVIKF